MIVHTRNEECNIIDCISSCSHLPAEIIVADMESTDRTVELARSGGARIVQLPFMDEFDAARNISAEQAIHEWILFLDADERLTPEVSRTIVSLVAKDDPLIAAFRLPFRVVSFGKWIRHAGNWWPSYKSPPLLRKGRFRFPGPVHMPALIDGNVVTIPPGSPEDSILHFSHRDVSHYFEKLNRYTSLEARKNVDDAISWQDLATSFGSTFAWFYDATNGRKDELAGFLLSLGSGIYEIVSRMKQIEISGIHALPSTAAEFLQTAANSANAHRRETYSPWVEKLFGLLSDEMSEVVVESSSIDQQSVSKSTARRQEDLDAIQGAYELSVARPASLSVDIRKVADEEVGSSIRVYEPTNADQPIIFRSERNRQRVELKAAIVTHSRALDVFGGGEVQLFETAKHLLRIGVGCDVFVGSPPANLDSYDIQHYFSLHHDHPPSRNKPAILTPIAFDRRELVEVASQVSSLFMTETRDAKIESGFAFLRARAEGLAKERPHPLVFGTLEYLSRFDCIAANCAAEIDTLTRSHDLGQVQKIVIPNGANVSSGRLGPPHPGFDVQSYVLCVGRIEPNKNQLGLIWALRRNPTPLVLVGQIADVEYGRVCKRIGGEQVHFLGEQPRPVVQSLMAHAICHALPSFGETPGLVNLEAAMMSCPIVVGDRGAEKEYFGNLAAYCDPLDPVSIADAVSKARRTTGASRDKLKTLVESEYSWEVVAARTREAYEQVIERWRKTKVKG